MDNTETFHNQRMVVADAGGFRLEADLFTSVQIIQRFGCHGQHWDVLPYENRCCRKRWIQIQSRPLQISTDDFRLSLSWTALSRLGMRKWLLQKRLVSYAKRTFANQYRWYLALAVMDNTETFHTKKMAVRETIGFRFKADPFESVPMILGFGCHGQHWDVSQ